MRLTIILMGFILISSFGGINLLPERFKIPVVLDFELKAGEQELVLTKQQEKNIKSYYKEKKFSVISKEQAQALLQKQMAEILNPFIRTAPEDLEKLKEESKRKMLSLPESSTWVHYTFYSSDRVILDSVLLTIYSSPYNAQKNRLHKKTISNINRMETVNFLNTALDSCIANNFFE
ncbi:MAG TPA: hypothetical protein PKI55_03255 [Chitinophagaceae bacterium]|nr:hypothetical protein [Chitinophagaceae bacterium]